MQTSRDRLIELIQSAVDGFARHFARHWAEKIADYLIENGVIVPPCKAGDMVYIPWQWNGSRGIAIQEIVKIEIYKNDFYYVTDMDSDDDEFIAEYGWFRPEQICKTVFLTEEEAEKAL